MVVRAEGGGVELWDPSRQQCISLTAEPSKAGSFFGLGNLYSIVNLNQVVDIKEIVLAIHQKNFFIPKTTNSLIQTDWNLGNSKYWKPLFSREQQQKYLNFQN